MSSHYKQIDGVKYSAAILEAADEMVAGKGDGRISQLDAEALFARLRKDGKYTQLEQTTVAYIRDNYKFTEAGEAYLRGMTNLWAAILEQNAND